MPPQSVMSGWLEGPATVSAGRVSNQAFLSSRNTGWAPHGWIACRGVTSTQCLPPSAVRMICSCWPGIAAQPTDELVIVKVGMRFGPAAPGTGVGDGACLTGALPRACCAMTARPIARMTIAAAASSCRTGATRRRRRSPGSAPSAPGTTERWRDRRSMVRVRSGTGT